MTFLGGWSEPVKKKDEEFCLSEKRFYFKEPFVHTKEQIEQEIRLRIDNSLIFTKDVREFIKRLKGRILAYGIDEKDNQIWLRKQDKNGVFDIIDELAGKELI